MDLVKSPFFKVALLLALLVLAGMMPISASATTYYLATAAGGGNDSNSGTSTGAPWLSPNHSLNCGDQIMASPGSYSAANFGNGKWGTVNCSGHGVAWLICSTFDACKISASGSPDMMVTASHWGIQGWEGTNTGNDMPCFEAFSNSSSVVIRDIIFANDIANGCYGSGFSQPPNGAGGVDYFVVIASIAYNAAQESSQCTSGFNSWMPVNYDTARGTHIFYSQDFAWGNIDPNPCDPATGGLPTDGEGFIFDTWDNSGGLASQGSSPPYTGQGVMENNISFFNGSSGLRIDLTSLAPTYIVNNTSYHNNVGTLLNTTWCGEIVTQTSYNVTINKNIAYSTAGENCHGNPSYTYFLAQPNSGDTVNSNAGYSPSGYNIYADNGGGPGGFSAGSSNMFGTNPGFANAPSSAPGAPNCGGFSSVIACMAPVIAEFTASGMAGWGYQPVSNVPNSDPLFPQWLCNVNLPSGLVTTACVSNRPAPPATVTIQKVQ